MGKLSKWSLLSSLALIYILIATSCQDPSTVGAGSFEGEVIEVSGSSAFDVDGKTIKLETPVSFSTGIRRTTFMVGSLDDPQLGTADGQVYSTIIRNPLTTAPVLDDVAIDSVVLVLRYDTLGQYGDLSAMHTLKIYEIDEDFANVDTIKSNRSLAVIPNVIGEKSFFPTPGDSVTITNHQTGEENRLASQIRVRIDNDWAANWMLDSATVSNDTSIYNAMKGINIVSESTNSLLGLNLGDESLTNVLTIYYTRDDTLKSTYDFRLGTRKFNNFVMGHDQGEVSSFIDDEEKGKELLFMQGMDGLGLELNFKDLSLLEGKVINHAELTLTLADDPEFETNIYRGLTQILASRYGESDEEQNLIIIPDISNLALGNTIPLTIGFGGNLQVDEDSGKSVYKCNITNRLKDIQKSQGLDTELVFTPSVRVQTPRRTVFYGVDHPEYPVTLKVTYTTP